MTKPVILSDDTGRIVSLNFIAKRLGVIRGIHNLNGARWIVKSQAGWGNNVEYLTKDVQYNKPETESLRHASWTVLDAIKRFREILPYNFELEYASNDEFYMDLTYDIDFYSNHRDNYPLSEVSTLGSNIHLEGEDDLAYSGNEIGNRVDEIYGSPAPKHGEEVRLIIGSVILEQIRKFVFATTMYEASCGVATNKLLAKIACPLHKPGGITILPGVGFHRLSYHKLILKDLPYLGPKNVEIIQWGLNDGNEMCVKRLAGISVPRLQQLTGLSENEAEQAKTLALGFCEHPVLEKFMKESLTVGKTNFRNPPLFIGNYAALQNAFYNLAQELVIRLEEEEDRHFREARKVQFKLCCKPPRKRSSSFNRSFQVDLFYDSSTEDIVDYALMGFENTFGNMVGYKIKEIELKVKNFYLLK